MEAYIIIVEAFVYQAGDNVLCGMLLHAVEAFLPVDLSGDVCAGRDGEGGVVPDQAIFFLGVQDFAVVQKAGVAGLTAAFGEECGSVQEDAAGVCGGFAVCNGGGKFFKITVFVV